MEGTQQVLANQNRFKTLMQPVLSAYTDSQINILVQTLTAMGFFNAPASTKYHSSYGGGLSEHSQNVTRILVDLTRDCNLEWSRSESPYIIGMFHDLCKCDQYRHPQVGVFMDGEPCTIDSEWEWNPNTLYKGHGEKSVMLASTLLKLTPEEVACIRYHMGAFTDKEEWADYTRAIHVFPNVLWTHHADMIATHIIEQKE